MRREGEEEGEEDEWQRKGGRGCVRLSARLEGERQAVQHRPTCSSAVSAAAA